jgi:4-hydroxy-tetrahydrodipicolinate synthase
MMFKGLYTALVTPFDDQNRVNMDSFTKLLLNQLEANVSGVVPLGTTGETPTLSNEEKLSIIRTTVKTVKGKLPIIVGTGSNSTQTTIENTKIAEYEGADAALVVTPYYNKPTSEGLYKHFEAVAQSTKLPIIVYNIPGRSAKNIDTLTLRRIAEFPNIKSVKEASGNLEQMSEIIDVIIKDRPDFTVLSGDDALTLPLISLGGHGVVSVVSNIIPKEMQLLVNSALGGNFEEAKRLHYKLLSLFKAAFIETNPIGIKTAMNLLGLSVGSFRLPLCNMQESNIAIVKKTLKELKLL